MGVRPPHRASRHQSFDGCVLLGAAQGGVAVAEGPLRQEDHEAIKAALAPYRDLVIVKLVRPTGGRLNKLLRIAPGQALTDGRRSCLVVRRWAWEWDIG